MALSKQEWKRRVAAACALHGLDISGLPKFDGLPVDAARRAGHPSDHYSPNHALAMALAEELDLPVAWFEAEDWRPLVSEFGGEAEAPATKADLESALTERAEAEGELRKELAAVKELLIREQVDQEVTGG